MNMSMHIETVFSIMQKKNFKVYITKKLVLKVVVISEDTLERAGDSRADRVRIWIHVKAG